MRNMSTRIILAIVLLVAFHLPCVAAFKDSGWGTRPCGMGGAFCAVADDASAPLWNPAGIVQLRYPEANFMYAKLFTGLDEVDLGSSYASCVFPFKGIGSFAINWTNFVSKDLYREDTISLSYGKNLKDIIPRLLPDFYLGMNLKYLEHGFTLDERTKTDAVFENGKSKYALTADIGLILIPYSIGTGRFCVGLSLKNVTNPNVGLKTRDKVPLEVRLGAAYRMTGYRIPGIKVEDITIALDFDYRAQEWGETLDKTNVHLGCEGWFFNRLVGLRAGGNINEITLGASLNKILTRYLGLQVDYAFIVPLQIEETSGTHRVSLTARF